MATQDDELRLASEHAELPEATEGTNCNSNQGPWEGDLPSVADAQEHILPLTKMLKASRTIPRYVRGTVM